VRVIAGTLKGRRLVTPRGDRTRPTADQVRIALMDALAPWLSDARVLDLFAGAGGVGFEALSRGATHATFVERDPRAIAALRDNVRSLGVAANVRVVRGDVEREIGRLASQRERFDVVFLDAPYDTELTTSTLARLADGAILAEGGVVVAQHLTKKAPAETIGVLRAVRRRRFGETTLTSYRVGES
jgi:16S rRNA (guanine966-N2)-methyltransferase